MANQRAADLGVPNFRAELNDITENQKEHFDIVLCVNMLHHSYDIEQSLRQVYSVLYPGGSLIIFENNPLNPLFPLFFIIIGQLKPHLTRSYFQVNRFFLKKLIINAGLIPISFERYGWLPTMLYNYSLSFKRINEILNIVPIFRELTAFHLIRAKKISGSSLSHDEA